MNRLAPPYLLVTMFAGAQLELVCSKPLLWNAGVDRMERWQLDMSLGFG